MTAALVPGSLSLCTVRGLQGLGKLGWAPQGGEHHLPGGHGVLAACDGRMSWAEPPPVLLSILQTFTPLLLSLHLHSK